MCDDRVAWSTLKVQAKSEWLNETAEQVDERYQQILFSTPSATTLDLLRRMNLEP